MIRLPGLPVSHKLAITLGAVALPLVAAGALTLVLLRGSLMRAAEVELTNVVNHLYKVCEAQQRIGEGGPGTESRPSPNALRFAREVFLSLKVGATGYAYCMDSRGNLILHPNKEGQNLYESRDTKGFPFIQEVCREAVRLGPNQVGTIRYPWRNEEAGETKARTKILKFRYFEPWDWIIAAGSYEEEVFRSVHQLGLYAAPLVVLAVVLGIGLTVALSRFFTHPLALLTETASRMARGDLKARVTLASSGDELAAMGRAFNTMADEILAKTDEMERLIEERTRALEESRDQYQSLVQSSVDGIVTTDLHGVITFVNQGFEALLGHSQEEMVGREVWRYYPAGRDRAKTIMRLLRERGNLVDYEMDLIGRDRIVPIRTSASILRDRTGAEQGTLGIFTDLTAEKKLQGELQEAQSRLLQTVKLRALGDLVAGVAHEVNNPLMASATMVYLMEQGSCPEGCPNRSRFAIVRRCNDRIAKIVEHLKEFSRQSHFERRELDVHVPLENALLLTGQQLLDHGVEVVKDFDREAPAVLGDANRLEQVFLNLIANARDALDCVDGPKLLSLRTRQAELEEQPAVAVDVEDTGPGIPLEVRDKIFEPFFTTKEVGKGTGLGLSISYGLIEEHGGRLEVWDRPGGGTRFTVVLRGVSSGRESQTEKEQAS